MGTRRYRVSLEVQGPVHIGNGNVLGMKDYFLQQGKVVVLDPAKFVAQLDEEQLANYCDFLNETNSRTGLEDFLGRHNLHRQAEAAHAYKIDTRLSRRRNGSWQYLDAGEFVKDAHGCPYIPGSSFKGMLRTALLAALIEDDRAAFAQDYPMGSQWHEDKNADDNMEKRAFWREKPDPNDSKTVNDIMRYVSVSDSDPLSTGDLVFARKYDKFSKGDKAAHKRRMGNQSTGDITEGNDLNIYRECLRPGTVATLHLSIDERIDAYLPSPLVPLDRQHLGDVLRRFEARYRACFLDAFDSGEGSKGGAKGSQGADGGTCRYVLQNGPFAGTRCRNQAVAGTGYCNMHKDKASEESQAGSPASQGTTCYLGGGVDFDSKTVLNALFQNEGERLREISHILYDRFPTKIDNKFAGERYRTLWNEVGDSGFTPRHMRVKYNGNRVKKAKDDHRHWMDEDLGVSPHTMKLGKVGNKLLPMGKCAVSIADEATQGNWERSGNL